MASKVLQSIRILLILALLIAAAVTPSLADAKAKKPAKRMKISFDSNEAATPVSEPLRPRASNRNYESRGETVKLRAQNIDDIWAANGGGVKNEGTPRALPNRDVEKIQIADGSRDAVSKSTSSRYAGTGLPSGAQPLRLGTKPKIAKADKKTVVAGVKPSAMSKTTSVNELDFVDLTREARETRRTYRVANANIPARRKSEVAVTESVGANSSESYSEGSRPYIAERAVVRDRGASSFDFKFVGEFNSNFSVGTSQTLNIEGQKNSIFINEVVAGVKDQSGWGALASGAFNAVSNADVNYDVREIGDASLIALHPDWYKDDSLRVSGSFRYFFPLSQVSKEVGLQHSAYSLDVEAKLANGFEIKNSLIGRYFWQTYFYVGDATTMIQDVTELTQNLTPEFSVGIGQQTRIEMHFEDATGTRLELVPLARYKVLSKVSLEVKAFLPIVKSGVVGLAPLAAAIPNPTAMFSARVDF